MSYHFVGSICEIQRSSTELPLSNTFVPKNEELSIPFFAISDTFMFQEDEVWS